MTLSKAFSALAVGCSLITVVACGNSSEENRSAPKPSEPETVTSSTPEPTVEDTPSDEPSETEAPVSDGESLSYAWTNADGYSFGVDVSGLSLSITTDVADQKPGEALVEATPSGSVTFSNTTSGRNASPDWVELRPVWALSSPMCAGANPLQTGSAFKGTDKDTAYCAPSSGPRSSVDELAESGSATVDLGNDSNFFNGSYKFVVPEADLDAAASAAAAPAFWALVRGSGDAGVIDNENPGACDGSYGATIVATTSGGATVCAQNLQ